MARPGTDPREDKVAILIMRRVLDTLDAWQVFADFWTSVYQAIDD
jgi:hypothetical protein